MLCGPPGGIADRCDDVAVGAAPADVATHLLPDRFVGPGAPFSDQPHRSHDLPWRAIAALECIMLDEGLLHRMEAAVLRQSLDRGDRLALRPHREREAGIDPPAVEQNGAGATLTKVAATFGAAQMQPI